jgi:hypothetical protein
MMPLPDNWHQSSEIVPDTFFPMCEIRLIENTPEELISPQRRKIYVNDMAEKAVLVSSGPEIFLHSTVALRYMLNPRTGG